MRATLEFLASFRLRLLFRGAFLLLALAVLTMAIVMLQEEKQRAYDTYQSSLAKTRAQIIARLHHPAGQLALLNPPTPGAAPLRPLVLPFAAIDFDDMNKAHHAVDMAGCLSHYPGGGRLCVGTGNTGWGGNFLYVVGSLVAPPLVAHRIGDEIFDTSTRLLVSLEARGQRQDFIAPFEPLPSGGRSGLRGRFTGYLPRAASDEGPANYKGAQPLKEFRGWVWQQGSCHEPAAEQARAAALAQRARLGARLLEGEDTESLPPLPDCTHQSFFSLRLPVELDAPGQPRSPWPPADLADFRVRIRILPPGPGPALFDSASPGATAPFALGDLAPLLQPGESLTLRRPHGNGPEPLIRLEGQDAREEAPAPWLMRLIRLLPVDRYDAPVELKEDIQTAGHTYQLVLRGDARSVHSSLGQVAGRVSWYVAGMLLAIGIAWLVIEIGLIRRIALLTRRTRGLSRSVHEEGSLEPYELDDLRGQDELGLLAGALSDLLRRIREDAERERLRALQEQEQWHAVGHEIMSPLQSLLVLHGQPDDPSHRYLHRMQQAIRVLYGSASPSEAIRHSTLQVQRVDISAFLHHVAENAETPGLVCVWGNAGDGGRLDPSCPLPVRADEYSLEDVLAHLLNNAERYRRPGTPITLTLEAEPASVNLRLHNQGPAIAPALLDKIFEYGVSDPDLPESGPHRGQGLFVARTYLAKMGGSLRAENCADGVVFILGLQRAG
ncbi:MAG: HAMP domain-containing sensor histidine kinase [Zoogloea sp.]|uniref:HAMP domain-containing sensor histidine kinase n=1 Tax=Zoogloea sp. TaxID=49181 RepID=UPI003F2F25DF